MCSVVIEGVDCTHVHAHFFLEGVGWGVRRSMDGEGGVGRWKKGGEEVRGDGWMDE